MTGYVYAIRCGDVVKLGWSKNPRRRFTMLVTGNPGECVLVGAISATIEQEQELHRLLSAHRVRREWFREAGPVAAFVSMLPPVSRQAPIVGDVNDHPLAVYRRQHGLTLKDFADMIGVKSPAVCRWETGSRFPRPDQIARISAVTEGAVTADWRCSDRPQ